MAERGLRITTWNVNGIRNPFGYQPWRELKTFEAMFDTLEADIVIMQETKIQRKDLKDDMVLVPGWDVHFSLPQHKKGYSGVAIYTRNATCSPIRSEEGITGVLCPPSSSTSFYDLPEEQQIGGYPNQSQIDENIVDRATLDSEGRCVILEFPAFVLLGVYAPATRDETRDDYRLTYLNALDARIRNLVHAGKRVILTGDINISREETDSANAEEHMRKQGITREEYLSSPARRLFNQLLVDGKVFGEKDQGREQPMLWDICRAFHTGRRGMYTCWETKVNARPGNFGSRIDYVLCSADMKDWFCESNIQEGLLGSDHCPVYAITKNVVDVNGTSVNIRDIMNPPGMFKNGIRQREWGTKDLLPSSARVILGLNKRRSIRDMFTKKPSLPTGESSMSTVKENGNGGYASLRRSSTQAESPTTRKYKEVGDDFERLEVETPAMSEEDGPRQASSPFPPPEIVLSPLSSTYGRTLRSVAPKPSHSPNDGASTKTGTKRPAESSNWRPLKRSKSGGSKGTLLTNKSKPGMGQSTLRGFFKPKTPEANASDADVSCSDADSELSLTAIGVENPGIRDSGALPVNGNRSSGTISSPSSFTPVNPRTVLVIPSDASPSLKLSGASVHNTGRRQLTINHPENYLQHCKIVMQNMAILDEHSKLHEHSDSEEHSDLEEHSEEDRPHGASTPEKNGAADAAIVDKVEFLTFQHLLEVDADPRDSRTYEVRTVVARSPDGVTRVFAPEFLFLFPEGPGRVICQKITELFEDNTERRVAIDEVDSRLREDVVRLMNALHHDYPCVDLGAEENGVQQEGVVEAQQAQSENVTENQAKEHHTLRRDEESRLMTVYHDCQCPKCHAMRIAAQQEREVEAQQAQSGDVTNFLAKETQTPPTIAERSQHTASNEQQHQSTTPTPTASKATSTSPTPPTPFRPEDQASVIDPIVAKESWSKLLSGRVPPRCEHNEPCVSMLTKKRGLNCGRSFYICPRPLGPSGAKEKNTEWRCGTFIWSSEWSQFTSQSAGRMMT